MGVVFDLGKCVGCQPCSVACKMPWTREAGEEHQWWCTVNTQPGLGTPRDWETMGGGYADGKLVLGHEPTREEFGGGWAFNHEEVLFGGRGQSLQLQASDANGEASCWGPNWDEALGEVAEAIVSAIEARGEWPVLAALCKKIAEYARERGLERYAHRSGATLPDTHAARAAPDRSSMVPGGRRGSAVSQGGPHTHDGGAIIHSASRAATRAGASTP